ncbi:hypothetical protein ACFFRR_007790 [Megaselia abdita]
MRANKYDVTDVCELCQGYYSPSGFIRDYSRLLGKGCQGLSDYVQVEFPSRVVGLADRHLIIVRHSFSPIVNHLSEINLNGSGFTNHSSSGLPNPNNLQAEPPSIHLRSPGKTATTNHYNECVRIYESRVLKSSSLPGRIAINIAFQQARPPRQITIVRIYESRVLKSSSLPPAFPNPNNLQAGSPLIHLRSPGKTATTNRYIIIVRHSFSPIVNHLSEINLNGSGFTNHSSSGLPNPNNLQAEPPSIHLRSPGKTATTNHYSQDLRIKSFKKQFSSSGFPKSKQPPGRIAINSSSFPRQDRHDKSLQAEFECVRIYESRVFSSSDFPNPNNLQAGPPSISYYSSSFPYNNSTTM